MTGEIVGVELQESARETPWNWCCLITATWEATEVYAKMREIDAWCSETLPKDRWKTSSVVWSRGEFLKTDYYFETQAQAVLFQMRWNP